ncbi:hypothetical protein JXA12_01600 [Candidatus Woesearchaeota archaeon]|nr:hypothetical protein [Candidatus Woesearchaeota archaeon]
MDVALKESLADRLRHYVAVGAVTAALVATGIHHSTSRREQVAVADMPIPLTAMQATSVIPEAVYAAAPVAFPFAAEGVLSYGSLADAKPVVLPLEFYCPYKGWLRISLRGQDLSGVLSGYESAARQAGFDAWSFTALDGLRLVVPFDARLAFSMSRENDDGKHDNNYALGAVVGGGAFYLDKVTGVAPVLASDTGLVASDGRSYDVRGLESLLEERGLRGDVSLSLLGGSDALVIGSDDHKAVVQRRYLEGSTLLLDDDGTYDLYAPSLGNYFQVRDVVRLGFSEKE